MLLKVIHFVCYYPFSLLLIYPNYEYCLLIFEHEKILLQLKPSARNKGVRLTRILNEPFHGCLFGRSSPARGFNSPVVHNKKTPSGVYVFHYGAGDGNRTHAISLEG